MRGKYWIGTRRENGEEWRETERKGMEREEQRGTEWNGGEGRGKGGTEGNGVEQRGTNGNREDREGEHTKRDVGKD